jgi:Fic family protein
LAKFVRKRWFPSGEGCFRRDRQGGEYLAYHPDLLVGRQFVFSGDVAADLEDAARAIVLFNHRAKATGDTEIPERMLLRAESVASSRIEGLVIGARKLLRAEVQRDAGGRPVDVTAAEVLANIDAMVHAVTAFDPDEAITPAMILEIHARLMKGSSLENLSGKLRTEQNWIGGSSFNPCRAQFVPPPPTLVAELMADLCKFCNDDGLPAVAQAAMANAQFEIIHPFVDGNGRTGRVLVHLVLRRRNLCRRVLPPISLVLATMAQDYIDGLRATQYDGAPTSRAARAGVNLWVGCFAGACQRAVDQVLTFEQRIEAIQAAWRRRLGVIRAGSAAELLVRNLVAAPVVSVKTASTLIGRTFPATNDAIARLVAAEVLKPIIIGKQRDRLFEAKDVIDAFAALERTMASPMGDTRVARPNRPVPGPPNRRD